jgi:AraC-like DNA-binding protein
MDVAADPGSGFDLRTHELSRAQAIMGGRFARHSLRVLDRRPTLDFSLRQANLDHITFLLVSYGRDVELETSGFRDFYLVQLTLAGVCEIGTDGGATAELGPGWIHVVNPGTAYRKRWSSDAEQLIVRVPRRSVQRLATAASDEQPVVFAPPGDPAPAGVDGLLRFFWHDIMTPGPARNVIVDRSAGRHLMTALLHSLPNSAAAVASPEEVPPCLGRADRYIRQNLARDIHLKDIAQAAGVSVRSLENAFRRYWRSTPTGHVRNLRLEAAHHLLTHPVRGMSVSDAATTVGFPHLGRFSRSYAQRFGELPSASLRRAVNPAP